MFFTSCELTDVTHFMGNQSEILFTDKFMAITIGRLAAKFGLSRSTLLYYDSIGLLSPAKHLKGEYRLYSKEDEKRLANICMYRKAGVSLDGIRKILSSPETNLARVLRARFDELVIEVERLQEQQRVIAGMLQNPGLISHAGRMDKQLWVDLLRASGFSEEDMRQWHIQFERMNPDRHRVFLLGLGLPRDEVEKIRRWARSGEEK